MAADKTAQAFWPDSLKGRFMNIQWYPGHMTKAKRSMQNDVKLVDLVMELLDARAPHATENPDIRKLCAGKKRLVLLNKADLADRDVTGLWIRKFRGEGCEVVALDARRKDALNLVRQAADRLCAEKWERDAKRGLTGKRPLKALVCGIPNVGKSTFINSVMGKASAKTGNKPGVTKGNQWLTAGSGLMLLDTPGVLWPKFEDQEVGFCLAEIGAISDQVLLKEEIAMHLIAKLIKQYPGLLEKRYDITEEQLSEALSKEETEVLGTNPKALAFLSLIAKKRGCLKRGGAPDYTRGAALLVDDFRAGRLGAISLERPDAAC